jgi:hypothetical protein
MAHSFVSGLFHCAFSTKGRRKIITPELQGWTITQQTLSLSTFFRPVGTVETGQQQYHEGQSWRIHLSADSSIVLSAPRVVEK